MENKIINEQNIRLHFMNTVWSDCILLEKDNHFALIDTASEFYYPNIKGYFDSLNISKFDFVLLTHFHSDHYGNLAKVLKDYKVQKLLLKHYSAHESSMGNGLKSDEEYFAHEKMKFSEIITEACKNNVKIVYLDDLKPHSYTIHFRGVKVELYNTNNILEVIYNDPLSPNYKKEVYSENANSIPCFIKIGQNKIYLASDLTDSVLSEKRVNLQNQTIIKKIYKKHHIDSFDICKSAHHGGGGTNRLDLANLIKVKYIIITNTDKYLNNWNTIENFKSANKDVIILKTDYYKYVFDINEKEIKYKSIENISPFIELSKN